MVHHVSRGWLRAIHRGITRCRTTEQRDNSAGFSMIEILIAFMILLSVGGALASLLMRGMDISFANRARVTATNLAEKEIELLRQEAPVNLATSGRTRKEIVINNTTYDVNVDLNWITQAATAGTCQGGLGNNQELAYIRADVTVKWKGVASGSVSNSSLVQPKDKLTGPGAIVVQLEGKPKTGTTEKTYTPNALVTLALPGGGTKQTYSDSMGCAAFTHLTPGAYTVSVNKPGCRDGSYNATPTKGFTVGNSAPQEWKFLYAPGNQNP